MLFAKIMKKFLVTAPWTFFVRSIFLISSLTLKTLKLYKNIHQNQLKQELSQTKSNPTLKVHNFHMVNQ